MGAAEAFGAWLGPAGTVPPPLDVFLSRGRADEATFRALTTGAAFAVTARAALGRGETAPGGLALLDQLRALPPRDLLAAAQACQGGSAPEPVRKAVAALRSRLWDREDLDSRCLLAGVPTGWAPALARREALAGSAWSTGWLRAQSRRPPLWVRARDPGVADTLRAEGFRVEADGDALRVEGRQGLEGSGAFKTGRLEIQDLASQRCGQAAPVAPGQIWWDACAGRGGKTLQLAEGLGGRGAVHATDVDPRKLEGLRKRVKRAGLANGVRIRAWDGLSVPDFGPEARRGFDGVLVDAPCSSCGTWRRNPDARLRIEPTAPVAFAETQRALLRLGAAALRPGGRLVYATCSFAVEEDEDVVALAADLGLAVQSTALHGPPAIDSDTLFVAVLG